MNEKVIKKDHVGKSAGANHKIIDDDGQIYWLTKDALKRRNEGLSYGCYRDEA